MRKFWSRQTLEVIAVILLLIALLGFVWWQERTQASEPEATLEPLEVLEVNNAQCDADVTTPNVIVTTQSKIQEEEPARFALGHDYLEEMIGCCVNGDIQGGRELAMRRNHQIAELGVNEVAIDFDELYLLSKIITAEAGSLWLPMEWKMAVGEVLLNRKASIEFPNTIEECVYAPNQYYSRESKYFANLIPWEDSVRAAVRLLQGERVLNDPSVVFQANFTQGSGVHTEMHDEILGSTYFCYSNYPERYEEVLD